MVGLDLAARGRPARRAPYRRCRGRRGTRRERRFKVVAYDFGMKQNILRSLAAAGCDVTVVPATTSARRTRSPLGPDGRLPLERPRRSGAVQLRDRGGRRSSWSTRAALRHLPRPPDPRPRLRRQDLQAEVRPPRRQPPGEEPGTGQVEITSQNHGFSVDPELFERPELVLTHVNLNDGTVEGFRHRELPGALGAVPPRGEPRARTTATTSSRDFVDDDAEASARGALENCRATRAIQLGAGDRLRARS